MKSRAKVISQKHIREIPPFCDNPMSSETVELQKNIADGKVKLDITPNRRQHKSMLRGSNKH